MTEETFVRELERHADHVHGAPLSFDDVRSKARSIRRRRRATAAAAVAAAVAVVAVVPAVLSGRLDRADEPQPAPPAPSPSAHTAVLHDGHVTLPDGRDVTLDVDNSNVVDYGVLTDGRIVVALQKPYAVRVYASDGTLDEQYPVQSNVVTVSAADDAAAWVADDFTVRVLRSGAAEPAKLPGIPMPGEAAGTIDAVLDAQHLLVGDGTTTTGELTPDGYRDLTTGEPLRVVDVSPDGTLWAVSFPAAGGSDTGCAGLYDPDAGKTVARSCELGGLSFSPDGTHLVGGYYENNAVGDLSVVDRDLRKVAGFRPKARTTQVSRVAWVDATHLIAATADAESDTWSLVSVGLDGSPDQVIDPPAPGGNPELTAEYLFSE